MPSRPTLPATRDDLLALLGALPPVERARVARMLAHPETVRALAATGDAAVHQATRDLTYEETADQLGVSKDTIRKAIKRHNKTTG